MKTRKGYWWECENCNKQFSFKEAKGISSLSTFIWDVLIPSDWDQSLLQATCLNCNTSSCKITYDFPRKEKATLSVLHIVGQLHNEYVPMMWETYEKSLNSTQKISMFDFKYQTKRNPWGLNKAAVLTREDLQNMFLLYRNKVSAPSFPL